MEYIVYYGNENIVIFICNLSSFDERQRKNLKQKLISNRFSREQGRRRVDKSRFSYNFSYI